MKLCLQVMINAVDMVAKLYEDDVFNKEPTFVHKIPCDTNITGYDRYPVDRSDAERDALTRATLSTDPDLVAEFRLLMQHHRSGILRDEFAKCHSAECPICSHKRWWKNSKLDRHLERFPEEMLPTPVPVWLPGDDHPSLNTAGKNRDDSGCDDNDDDGDEPCGANAQIRKQGSHYRTLGDLLKASLPNKLLFPDAFYSGAGDLLRCSSCPKPFKVFKTKSGLERHRKLHHVL